jgi:hypothetical protein
MTDLTDDDELRGYLIDLITDDIDRQRAHLEWLNANPDEPDRDLQRAESERALQMADKAISILTPSPDTERV